MMKFFSFLFFVLTSFINAGDQSISENKLMIQQALQETNETFFFPRSMHLSLLKNCPQAIPILAQWTYEEWHRYDRSLTVEKMIQSFQNRVNNEVIPTTFVLLKDETPIGLVSLKNEIDPELSYYPPNSLWMGTLYIAPEERNKGLDQDLFNFSLIVGKRSGYEELYVYISNPDYVNWYCERGAQVIEERDFRNHTISVMKISLADVDR